MFVQPRDYVLVFRIALNKILSRAHSSDSSIKMSNIFNHSAQDQVNNLTNAEKRQKATVSAINYYTGDCEKAVIKDARLSNSGPLTDTESDYELTPLAKYQSPGILLFFN